MSLTKDEANILLYLETCLVDHRGFLQPVRMNSIDWTIMERWKKDKLIDFGRRAYKNITKYPAGAGGARTHWVQFTDKAWTLAYRYRRERAERHTATLEEVNE